MPQESASSSFKQRYWDLRRTLNRYVALAAPRNSEFRKTLAVDLGRYAFRRAAVPVTPSRQHLDAAIDWLLTAQRASPDKGVSLGYFPCNEGVQSGWMPSYPETTGYIIQTLVEYAARYDRADVLNAAKEMGEWEASIQMPSGAVQGGPVCPPPRQRAAVFNTGMVLQGLTALMGVGPSDAVAQAARRAADFLVEDQGADGHFQTHGPFVKADRVKTYNCLCAWALHRYGDLVDDSRYTTAAVKAAEAAMREQHPNGWFANNCLTRPDAPLTHTIGYTLQGLLETGALAQREDIIDAARRGADAVLSRVDRTGHLPARFDADWKPRSLSSCLTGNAQIAVVAYRLCNITGRQEYRDIAGRLLRFLAGLQILDSPDHGIRGAIAGSFPVTGDYMAWGYPNWATKYFADALIEQSKNSGKASAI